MSEPRLDLWSRLLFCLVMWCLFGIGWLEALKHRLNR